MTPTAFAPPDTSAKPLALVDKDGLAAWRSRLSPEAAAWVEAQGFTGGHGASIVFPDRDGRPASAAVGLGTMRDRSRNRYALAKARTALPDGAWTLEHALGNDDLAAECLGWLLEGYRFARYRDLPVPKAMLVAPAGIDAARIEALAAAEVLTRDLINTPANDMGPADLAQAAQTLAQRHGASFGQIVGDALLDRDFPLIHAVGAASPRAPRLIDLRWGDTGPRVTLVGKGVCFDTGGLNLKPGESMGLMKKDMGGAATVLGLASLILTLGMQIRLRVLIPAVENAVSGAAFRPGDILRSRKGLTVEINNTDAEGRLVLADALAYADEETPDLIVSMATLTGAARVAVGPDIAPFFTDSDQIATALSQAGQVARDPVWRLPFWDPYETMIEPGIADLDNAPKGGFAGAITAALFLRRFVAAAPRYVHFDIYGWQPTRAPGRPKGGVGQGARAIFGALPRILPEVAPR
jgi:leucyl aminopeptidase